jgi:UDP-glucose 4-epimerase
MTAGDGRLHRTVLVTGAAGFIGSALCEKFLSAGYSVIGYDNMSRGRREHVPAAVRLVDGDIRDAARLAETISASSPSCVIHLAAMHFIPDCIARPLETHDVNVTGTRVLLDACRGSSVQRVVFASSGAVYRATDQPCLEDATPLGPLEIYGESKLAGEQLASTFHDETGVGVTILRLFNAIGRRETNPHVVPHIFESLQKSDDIALGNIEPRRDYIDTRDVAEAILAVVDRSRHLQVFNVGTGLTYSVSDIVARLRRILGRPINVVQELARMRATERMVLAADITRIRRATQWAPRLSLDDTLKDLIAAYGVQTQPYSTP